MMTSLLTYICVIRPQRVKIFRLAVAAMGCIPRLDWHSTFAFIKQFKITWVCDKKKSKHFLSLVTHNTPFCIGLELRNHLSVKWLFINSTDLQHHSLSEMYWSSKTKPRSSFSLTSYPTRCVRKINDFCQISPWLISAHWDALCWISLRIINPYYNCNYYLCSCFYRCHYCDKCYCCRLWSRSSMAFSGIRYNNILLRSKMILQWRHNGRDGVPNHQSRDCLPNRLLRHRSKKTSKLRVTGLCAGNSPVTGEFHLMTSSWFECVCFNVMALMISVA